MKRINQLLIVAMAISILPVVADNFAPPDYVGDPLSYHAEWEFLSDPFIGENLPDFESDGGPKAGEFLYNLAGGTHIDVDGPGWSWDPGEGGMVNIERDASFAINTINWVDEEPEKFIRVQITYLGLAPTVVGATGYEGASSYGPFSPYSTVDVDPIHRYSDIAMVPNPDWEQIEVFVPMGTIIDEIVVDSVSIPEPTVIALIGIFGIGLFIRKRLLI